MATFQFTSAASQTGAELPETGIVMDMTVDGLPWAHAQTGAYDKTIDFAPALKAGRAVVISYVPVIVQDNTAFVDAETLLTALATKQNTLTPGTGVSIVGNTIAVPSITSKADVSALDTKVDQAAVASALSTKADKAALDAAVAALEGEIASLPTSSGGATGPAPIAFSAAIPLDRIEGYDMGAYTQSGAIAFTIAPSPAPVDQGSCNVQLTTDSSHPVTVDPSITQLVAFEPSKVYDLSFFRNGAHNYRLYGREVGAAPVPGKVTGLTLGTATVNSQPLSWAVATGSPTNYIVEYKLHTDSAWTTFAHAASTATSIAVTGLPSNASLDYRVSAVNGLGTGTASDVATGSTAAPAAGSITAVDTAMADINLSTAGFNDWLQHYGQYADVKLGGVGLVDSPVFTNGMAMQSWSSGSGITITREGTDSTYDQTTRGADAFQGCSGSTAGTMAFQAQADLADHAVYVWAGDGCVMRLTLSDGSATEQLIPLGPKKLYVITYRAAANGQHLTVSLEANGVQDFFTFAAIAYKATP